MIAYERFLTARRALWDDFDRGLERARSRPRELDHRGLETLALQYRQVLHDHALAAARFSGTAAARRLHALALAGTHWLQRDESTHVGGLRTFFNRTFPRALRRQLDCVAIAVCLFVVSALLGLFLATARPAMGMAFLGPAAIDGLKHGHLWTESLVTTVPPSVASSAIATNNMSVSIMAWAGGAAAGLGALYVVLLNGVMLGAIFGVTAHYGMAGELLEFVSAHGPLEITLILVSAGAGLAMGRALVQASDRPRRDALREAGRDATIVLVGCLPWFVMLGFVEAYLSPSPALPALLKTALGVVLWGLFLVAAVNPALAKEAP
jgi:uncharacterized membrane protein SpoIIM required for sporulation